MGCLVLLSLPRIGFGIGQADVGKDAVGELAGHFVEAVGVVVEGGDEGVDGGSGIGGAVHVPDMDFIERGLANAEDQRTLFFEADVGGAFDELGGDPIGDAGQGADAAREHDHGVAGIGAAGNVGADVGVGLQVDFFGGLAEQLLREVRAALEFKFFGHDADCAVRCDEVGGSDAGILFDYAQEFAEEQRATGSGGGDGQILGSGGFGGNGFGQGFSGRARSSRPS